MTDILQQEQRHIRQRLTVATHVYKDDGAAYGQLIDIGQKGFIIECTAPPAIGESLLLTLVIPGLDEMHNLKLTTECYSCKPTGNKDLFHVGFHITTISDQNQVALNYFIRDF